MTAHPSPTRVLDLLKIEIERMREHDPRLPRAEVRADSSVMTDLGFDSISIVELVCGLEQALGVGDLPLASWLADESEREDGAFSVSSLVAFTCREAAEAAGRRG
jgi:acyl carrier protein